MPQIPLNQIHDSSQKLREVTEDESFNELVASIEENGLIQPIKVRPAAGGYELIYGHRRAAAMRQLGWETTDAIVEEVNDDEALVQAIAENLQRHDLTAIEEASIFQSLVDKGRSKKDIAKMVSKSAAYIDSRLSLFKLPDEVRDLVQLSSHDP